MTDRTISPGDRLAFAAYAAFRTVPIDACRLHWTMAPPQDKDRWRKAAQAVLDESRRQECEETEKSY